MLGQPPSSAAAADATAAPSGILLALQWLLREQPHRCLTASAGAWLLLQELLAPAFHAHATSQQQQGGEGGEASSPAAAASAGSKDSGSSSSSDAQPADFLMPAVGPLLQAFVDRGYASAASPPTLAAAAASGAASSAKGGGAGGGHTTPRRLASKDRVDSSSGVSSPRGPRPTPDAAAGSASPPPATPAAASSSLPPEFAHPICLLDDPHSEVFATLLARLHVIQVQLLLLTANERDARHAAASRDGGKRSNTNRWQGAVPPKMHLQSVAVLTCWLSQSAGPVAAARAAAATGGGGSPAVPAAHEALAPLPAVAVQAMEGLGISRPHSGVQLVLMAARDGIYTDCAHFLAAQAREARATAAAAAAAEAAGSSNSSGGDAAAADASSSADASSTTKLDAQLTFRTLLGCASVLQACGFPDAFLLLFEPLMASARCCDAQQVVQLIQQEGGNLLRVLTDNVASAQDKAKAKLAAAAAADERSDEAAMAAAAAEAAAKGAGAAAMIAAQVLMEVCAARGPSSRSGVGE
jgi:hypothetical protein